MTPAEGGEPRLSEMLGTLRAPHVPSVPSFEVIGRTVERVLDRFGTPSYRPEKDPERLIADMRDRIAGWNWQKVPMSFVARVGRLVFSAPWRDREDCIRIQSFLLDEIAISTRSGFLNPLVQTYVSSFDALSDVSRKLGQALERARDRLGRNGVRSSRRCRSFSMSRALRRRWRG